MKAGEDRDDVYQNNHLCGLMRGECLGISSVCVAHELPEFSWSALSDVNEASCAFGSGGV